MEYIAITVSRDSTDILHLDANNVSGALGELKEKLCAAYLRGHRFDSAELLSVHDRQEAFIHAWNIDFAKEEEAERALYERLKDKYELKPVPTMMSGNPFKDRHEA